MIYDLKELAEVAAHIYKHISDREGIVAMSNIAIAERLEALVVAQKPRWVVFESDDREGDPPVIVNANTRELPIEYDQNGKLLVDGRFVKGTLAEVIAKINGESK